MIAVPSYEVVLRTPHYEYVKSSIPCTAKALTNPPHRPSDQCAQFVTLSLILLLPPEGKINRAHCINEGNVDRLYDLGSVCSMDAINLAVMPNDVSHSNEKASTNNTSSTAGAGDF